MDNSVVIAGGKSRRGLNGNGKNTIKIFEKTTHFHFHFISLPKNPTGN